MSWQIAVIWTIPWDSYLIQTRIWTYPADSVIGYTLFKIPLEEVFFFVIQTYNTSLLYILLGKPLVLPIYLAGPFHLSEHNRLFLWRDIGTLFFSVIAALGIACIYYGEQYTYIGLIITWVSPIMILQWLLTYRFLLALPPVNTLVPILLPTAYLWLVDTIALRRGTWVIEEGTKLNLQLWSGLEIETWILETAAKTYLREALFFFVTNLMIVFGLVAIDNAIALHEYRGFMSTDPVGETPSIVHLVVPFIKDNRKYDLDLLRSLSQAVSILRMKSQSMWLGSATFEGQLRMDLISLYSFCRKADDLIDDAPNRETAEYWIDQCAKSLEVRFNAADMKFGDPIAYQKLMALIPAPLHAQLHILPVSRLLKAPFFSLLEGFKTDLDFDSNKDHFPIATEEDLELYAYRVAGTIAELLLDTAFRQYMPSMDDAKRLQIISSGERMGQALQYVNIARDIATDASINRVYIPTSWLSEVGLTPEMVVDKPDGPKIALLRRRMLEKADACYKQSQASIAELPPNIRGPVRATVKSYMEIGHVIRENEGKRWKGKLKVPFWRRVKVAWLAMAA
ncbi:phytoene synthase [Penicillium sp. DV-2018c]|nr:phytoene synthase [Penicillium sp. DV-2018c]